MDYPIHPKKSLGQNFLTCQWVISDIINTAHLLPTDTVLEIGPGTGVLTRPLAALVKKVVAVEKDEQLAQTLTRQLQSAKITNVTILEGDILNHVPELPSPYKIVANIPYYLTARLLRLFLEEQREKPSSMTLTIQKEVAERIMAKPPHENLLGLSVQVFGTPRIITSIPASCFSPKPKVDSAIMGISDISDKFFVKHRIDAKSFFRIMRLGFSQKRKILINSLSSILDKKTLIQLFSHLDIEPKTRPEQLTPDQWAALTRELTL